MNSLPVFRHDNVPGRRQVASFTLIELLVSITIMVILLALLSSFFSLVNTTWITGKSSINNFAKARTSLDIMALDYQVGIFRPDVPAFVGGANEFYTLRQSISANPNYPPRSLICYQVVSTATNSYLQRASVDSALTIPFTATNTMPTATGFLNMVNGVLKMQVSFLTPTGSISSTYATGDKAIGVDLATVDDSTLAVLVASGKLTQLCNDPAFTVNTGQTPYQSWAANFNDSATASNAVNYANYPASVKSGLQLFERYVPLP